MAFYSPRNIGPADQILFDADGNAVGIQAAGSSSQPVLGFNPTKHAAIDSLVSGAENLMFPPARVSAAGPVVAAHRGSRLTAPENSMAAFKAAYAAGVRHIEMDLQVNAAGQCVVMHDTTVARTCAGIGTASGATTNAAGYAIGIGTVNLASAGTGSIVIGDKVRFGTDTTIYTVTSGDADVSGGGAITFTPVLVAAIPASATAITVGEVACYSESEWSALRINALLSAAGGYRSEAPPFFSDVLDWAVGNDVVLVLEPKGATTAIQRQAYYAACGELRRRGWPRTRVIWNSFTVNVMNDFVRDGWLNFYNSTTYTTGEIDTVAAAGWGGISWPDSGGTNWTPANSAYAASKGLTRWASDITRRWTRDQLIGLVDYVSTDDAVYLLGLQSSPTDQWGVRQFLPGMQEGLNQASSPTAAARGTFNATGWVLDGTAGYVGCMQGYAAPVDGTAATRRAQTIRFQAQFTSVTSDTRHIDVGLCRADDRNYQDGSVTRSGYFVLFRRNRGIEIFSTPASGGSTNIGTLASGTNLTLGTTYTFEVVVTATTITANVYAADGVTLISGATLTAANAAWSGGYFDIGANGCVAQMIAGSLRVTTP